MEKIIIWMLILFKIKFRVSTKRGNYWDFLHVFSCVVTSYPLKKKIKEFNQWWASKIKIVIFEKNYRDMAMLGIIGFLFILAIICPYVLPNEKVSTHKKDHV